MDVKSYTASRIREYRKLRGLTQKELGEKIGVKHNTISGYESGTNEPEQDLLFKIASALEISINDLFPDTTNNTSSYYYDDEVAAIANEMKENPGMRVLFDASRGLKKESIEEVRRFIEFQKARERGDYEE
ncbi:MAG: helix-turn-helix domain-containing protein [Selenomonas noxia]